MTAVACPMNQIERGEKKRVRAVVMSLMNYLGFEFDTRCHTAESKHPAEQ